MNRAEPGGLDHCVVLHLGLTAFDVFAPLLGLLYFLTVKHQRNEVLPGFGIEVCRAKRTCWKISVFSCWQSIYLPSNVECVCGMNIGRHEKMEEWMKLLSVCISFLQEMVLSFKHGTHHYTILKNPIT